MALVRMSSKETLGDSATHFFKSGNILRNKENDALSSIQELLPIEGPNGTRVEYDLWYDTGVADKIHGYVYTDAMAKFLYIRIPSKVFAFKKMQEAAKGEITEEGLRIFEDLAKNSLDKYKLRKAREQYPFVIFLPGTNIINDVLNWDRLHNAIKQGAKLKCHPISSPSLVTKLKAEYGADNILDKKVSGHQYLENAKVVGCCSNSEMGLVALAKGKQVHLFDRPEAPKLYTYSAIYDTLLDNGRLSEDKFKRILSNKECGLIPVIAENPQEYIDNFFNSVKDIPHVSPKNPNS